MTLINIMNVSLRSMSQISVITWLFIEVTLWCILSFLPVSQLPKKPGESWLQLSECLESDGYQVRGR